METKSIHHVSPCRNFVDQRRVRFPFPSPCCGGFTMRLRVCRNLEPGISIRRENDGWHACMGQITNFWRNKTILAYSGQEYSSNRYTNPTATTPSFVHFFQRCILSFYAFQLQKQKVVDNCYVFYDQRADPNTVAEL
jgi:hypothetical protein